MQSLISINDRAETALRAADAAWQAGNVDDCVLLIEQAMTHVPEAVLPIAQRTGQCWQYPETVAAILPEVAWNRDARGKGTPSPAELFREFVASANLERAAASAPKCDDCDQPMRVVAVDPDHGTCYACRECSYPRMD